MSSLPLTPAEIGERGSAIYQSRLKCLLEPSHHGQFVAIDIDSGEYALGEEAHLASDHLRSLHPKAPILVERIGYPAAFHVRFSGEDVARLNDDLLALSMMSRYAGRSRSDRS